MKKLITTALFSVTLLSASEISLNTWFNDYFKAYKPYVKEINSYYTSDAGRSYLRFSYRTFKDAKSGKQLTSLASIYLPEVSERDLRYKCFPGVTLTKNIYELSPPNSFCIDRFQESEYKKFIIFNLKHIENTLYNILNRSFMVYPTDNFQLPTILDLNDSTNL